MKQIIAVLFLTTICGIINAQNLKFGKPTNEELVMTVYDNDPDASAVVLCQLTTVSYTIDYFNYFVDYQVKKRIKILKDEGKEYESLLLCGNPAEFLLPVLLCLQALQMAGISCKEAW